MITSLDSLHNPGCDGSGPCTPGGMIRVLPIGTEPHHGNLLLCLRCYMREMEYRRQRIAFEGVTFDLPRWDTLKVYGV